MTEMTMSTKEPRIFLSPPHMGGKELDYIHEVFESNYIAPLGPMLDRFEKVFAEYLDIPHCVGLASGTAAMHLILRHLGIGPGDRVFASALTFIGSVSPITFVGAEPVFIDCDRHSWNMDTNLLEEALKQADREGHLPKAVIPTDLYGQCCDLPNIVSICNRYDIPVICDSAESLGPSYRDPRSPSSANSQQPTASPPTANSQPPTANRQAGYGAYASVYSFNGNKIITTSGGGMLATEDATLAVHARHLATQARDPFPHYHHSEIGYNYRMSNVVAAIGVGQMEVLDERVQRKREVFDAYRTLLKNLPGLEFMPEADYGKHNRWLTVLQLDPEICSATPDDVRLALEEDNIESRPLWMPMHLQPVFGGGMRDSRCEIRDARTGNKGYEVKVIGGEVAEDLFKRGLCLPSGTAMTDVQIQQISDTVKGCLT